MFLLLILLVFLEPHGTNPKPENMKMVELKLESDGKYWDLQLSIPEGKFFNNLWGK